MAHSQRTAPQNSRSPDRIEIVAVCLCILLAAAPRLAALGQKPLWCDELATLQRLGMSFADHLRAMRGNHPLYELLLRAWIPSPDPQAWLRVSETWLRLPSALMGVLAVWLTWRIARGAGKWEAIAAALLMALSPLHLMFSRIGRAYSLACLLALLSNLALLRAIRRGGFGRFAAYALTTALMVYSNLIAVAIWAAQAAFIAWLYGRRARPGRLRQAARKAAPWLLANAAVLALLAPWLIYSLRGAVTWGIETKYTATQLGALAKACYLPFTLCLGETLNPAKASNLPLVAAAFVGFGASLALGAFAGGRNRALRLLFAAQAAAALAAGIIFSAASSKHLLVALPAWCALAAAGSVRVPRRAIAAMLAALMLVPTVASLRNYFADSQFADADMVTPWRQMASSARDAMSRTILIGYRPDRGAYDMFRRYYRGSAQLEYLDFSDWRGQIERATQSGTPVALLLHDGDPWQAIEAWLQQRGLAYSLVPFQIEEHTLQGLREGLRHAGKYRSPLYRLYLISAPAAPAAAS